MNYRSVVFLLGRLLLALGVTLLVPAGVALYYGEAVANVFFISAAIVVGLAVLIEVLFRTDLDGCFGRRDAFMLVAATWAVATLVGALPYVLIKGPSFVVDGLFESASGFTTTGASILDDVEAESQALLLWRSLTQWLGGMGIIVLGIAVLPKLAIGGMELLGAEAPGPVNEKLTPRIARTAKALWGIYAGLTGVLFGLLTLLGMGKLDALNHALTTMATGGFSTRNASVGVFGGAIQMVIMAFMVLAGVNFALHFNLLRGKSITTMTRDSELRFYLGLILVAAILIGGDLVFQSGYEPVEALRLGAFQTATVVTTTGFSTADFDAWPNLSRGLIFMLMFVGGCGGSTGGSIKVIRILILLKHINVEVRRTLRPRAVIPVRLSGRAVPIDVVTSVTTFFLLFLAFFAVGGLLLTILGLEPISAFSASATCLANVGPGFGEVGPTHTMGHLPGAAKLILTGLMIVGRLELYAVLVALFLCGEGLAKIRWSDGAKTNRRVVHAPRA